MRAVATTMVSAAASARVGFSNGSGQPGTLPSSSTGSGQNGAFLDGGGPGTLFAIKSQPPIRPYPGDATSSWCRMGGLPRPISPLRLEIIEDDDVTGFDLVVRNFGPSEATPVQADFRPGGRR